LRVEPNGVVTTTPRKDEAASALFHLADSDRYTFTDHASERSVERKVDEAQAVRSCDFGIWQKGYDGRFLCTWGQTYGVRVVVAPNKQHIVTLYPRCEEECRDASPTHDPFDGWHDFWWGVKRILGA